MNATSSIKYSRAKDNKKIILIIETSMTLYDFFYTVFFKTNNLLTYI